MLAGVSRLIQVSGSTSSSMRRPRIYAHELNRGEQHRVPTADGTFFYRTESTCLGLRWLPLRLWLQVSERSVRRLRQRNNLHVRRKSSRQFALVFHCDSRADVKTPITVNNSFEFRDPVETKCVLAAAARSSRSAASRKLRSQHVSNRSRRSLRHRPVSVVVH